MKINHIFLLIFIFILSINLGSSESSISYSAPDEHLCYISFNYIQNVSQTDYSKIDEFRENYLWTTFREYLDNWQYYCSDKVGRSLKEDVICSRVNNLLEETKGNYELADLNDIRNELTNHIKISNNLLDKYAKNYNIMCKFINKSLTYETTETIPEGTKIKNQVVFFIILSFIILFGLYILIRGDKKEKKP